MKPALSTVAILALAATARAQTAGQYANVNGLKMYYELHGDGFPLVLIHGGGSTIETTFGRILPTLAKTHKVIAVEMQAHGRTADIDRPLSFEQDADDIAELLRQLHIEQADIFGFSNGASTTLEMAIRHPNVVRKIVVASTMYKKSGAPPGFWDGFPKATFDVMPKVYVDAFLQVNPDTNAVHRMFERDVARMRSFRDIPDAQIKSITAPALVLAGDQDVLTPEHAVEMYRNLQHAQLAIFPGGHGGYLGEILTMKPGQTEFPAVAVIEEFLNGKP